MNKLDAAMVRAIKEAGIICTQPMATTVAANRQIRWHGVNQCFASVTRVVDGVPMCGTHANCAANVHHSAE